MNGLYCFFATRARRQSCELLGMSCELLGIRDDNPSCSELEMVIRDARIGLWLPSSRYGRLVLKLLGRRLGPYRSE